MPSAHHKIEQLRRVREVRRKGAQSRNAAARAELSRAEAEQERRRLAFVETVEYAGDARRKRLEAVFLAADRHGIHQAMAVGAYEITQAEIDVARQAWRAAREDTGQRILRAEMTQRELARSMQLEEKTRLLAGRLLQIGREAGTRQD
jgi:hypothetical protein